MKFDLSFIDSTFDFFESKGLFAIIVSSSISKFVLGMSTIALWLSTNGFQADHYIIGAIGQFIWVSLNHFIDTKNNVSYKSNLDIFWRLIWNLVKINAGGLLALLFTPFLSTKVLTIFTDFQPVLAAAIGVLSHYFVKFVEQYMKIKEKELKK